jgi:nitroreductase
MDAITEIPGKFDNLVLETIYKRRAVRKFTQQPVDSAIIEKILDAGRMAPSAINKQPWHFYILRKPENIQAFSEAIMSSSKMAMFKAGIKEAFRSITHPGTFHLKDGVEFFKASDPVFHNAPLVIFLTSSKTNEWAPLDIGMCAQNMMLAAKSLGVDSCPIGFGKFIENAEEYKILNIPNDQHVNLALIFGYANETPALHPRTRDNASYVD